MTRNVFGVYVTDDGSITCAVEVDPDTYAVMGFSPAPVGMQKQPRKLVTRKEVFYNDQGKSIRLVVPTPGGQLPFGVPFFVRADPTYVGVQTLTEINRAEV